MHHDSKAEDVQHQTVADTEQVNVAGSTTAEPAHLSAGELVKRMAKVAFTPQKLVLLLVFLVAAVACARLGVWQLSRAYERANLAQQHEQAEAAHTQPDAIGDVLNPQTTFPGKLVGKRVTVSGIYQPDNRLLVVDRQVDGMSGFLILDELIVTDDGRDGESWAGLSGAPRLPVVRGWVPTDAVDDSGQLTEEWQGILGDEPQQVALEGWLQVAEAAVSGDLPSGQTHAISVAELANRWGGPIYSGYLVVSAADPAQNSALVTLPRPQVEGSEGLNLQNLFYALQWWVFGGFAVALWLRLVRDEARRTPEVAPTNPFELLDTKVHD